MKQPILNNEKITRLDTLARVGSNKIADSLSRWLGTKIITNRSEASIVHYSQLIEPSYLSEDVVAAILIKISGSVGGYLIFLFSEKSAIAILTRILHRELNTILELDDLSRSVMEETGNIIGTAFLNTVAEGLHLEIYPSSPVIACDFSGAIAETIMAQFAMGGEYALSCRISFNSEDNEMIGTFSMLPDDIRLLENIL